MKKNLPLIIVCFLTAVMLAGMITLFLKTRDLVLSDEVFPETEDSQAETGISSETEDVPAVPAEAEIAQEPEDTLVIEEVYTEESRQLELSVTVDNIQTDALTDDDYYTVQRYEANAVTVLEADDAIMALYFVWDELPGSFILTADGIDYDILADTYLHQTVILPQPASEVSLTMPDHSAFLCDLYAYAPGILPAGVQQWQTLSDDESADLLLFSTHADDEFLFFGGTIPKYIAQGKKVQVAYMIHHTDYDSMRNHELLNGLWAAGCTLYPVIGSMRDALFYSYDEALYYYGWEAFTGFQVEQIRRFKPSVIVTHDFNGEYGHGAHMLTAHCISDAVELASDPEQFPESAETYGVWDTPKLYSHLYWEEQVVLDYETPLDFFNGATAAEIAVEAYSYYYSQHEYFPEIYFSGYLDSHVFGLCRSTVGNDVECSDLFENIA